MIRFVILFGFRARWKISCQVHVHLPDSNIFGITEFFHCWYPILEYPFVTLSYTLWRSSTLLYQFVVCFLACHVFLRVTMTSSTQGKIIGYLARALLWIGHFFVYHTCKKGRFTFKYVINTDLVCRCDGGHNDRF